MSNLERYEAGGEPRGGDDRAREERDRGSRGDDRDRGDRRRGPVCFNCNEVGHYAKQCLRLRRFNGAARPLTSTNPRRTRSPRRGDWRRESAVQLDPGVKHQINELGRSVASMQQHFEEERIRKENRLRRKQEKEEEKQREEERRICEEEERAFREAKAAKKGERKIREAESRAELKKDLGMQLAMQVHDMEDKFVQHKAVGDRPPMESPAKRTPGHRCKQVTFTGRLTRARTKVIKSPGSAKRRTPVRTPLSAAKKRMPPLTPGLGTPDAKSSLARYKYRNLVMVGLKQLDGNELQRICREKGIPYDGKIDAIFDIADHRTYLHFGDDQAPMGPLETIHIKDSEATKPTEDKEDEATR
ncbi:hypothetical protein CBR_g10967 [Chara braunii]|uniref:CCHC-type domain-containing protein n=1 Tax=Chara braunii TaxID=69332 RepID=A0A388KPR9_CHABU|nr:hypothetical protein CBR_g10967 [Chara braunii]|eukprot:GBG72032.1 hypothetical protein CBR_g10967 [Chara braunii]